MAIIFQKNVRNNFQNSGFLAALIDSTTQNGATSPQYATSFTIWGGVQPSSLDFAANYQSTYRLNYLVHLPNMSIWQPNASVVDTGVTVTNYNIPTAATAPRSGTATWGVLWQSNLPEAQISANPIPTMYPRYVIIPISDVSGTYPVRMLSTSISAGTSYSIADLTITSAGGIS